MGPSMNFLASFMVHYISCREWTFIVCGNKSCFALFDWILRGARHRGALGRIHTLGSTKGGMGEGEQGNVSVYLVRL